jgi:hypothetical protein
MVQYPNDADRIIFYGIKNTMLSVNQATIGRAIFSRSNPRKWMDGQTVECKIKPEEIVVGHGGTELLNTVETDSDKIIACRLG